MSWQAGNTAPTDGTPFQAWLQQSGRVWWEPICRLLTDDDPIMPDDSLWIERHGDPQQLMDDSHWDLMNDGFPIGWIGFELLLWMPLPRYTP